MIRVRDLVPEVYYNESRDFQTIGRVYEALFNHCKTNADIMRALPISGQSDGKMLRLMAATLGFQGRRDYDDDELRALCVSLIQILRLKGSKSAIVKSVNVMLNAHGIDEVPMIVTDPNDSCNYLIYVSKRLSDTTLLEDLMDYILPAGFTYRLITASSGDSIQVASIGASDKAKAVVFGTGTSAASQQPLLGNVTTEGNALDASVISDSDSSRSLACANIIVTPTTGDGNETEES